MDTGRGGHFQSQRKGNSWSSAYNSNPHFEPVINEESMILVDNSDGTTSTTITVPNNVFKIIKLNENYNVLMLNYI